MNKIQKTVGVLGTSAYVFLLTATTAFAQIVTPTGTTTIGAPTTGAAGELTSNILMLTCAALLAIGGSVYLMRTRKAA